MLRQALALVLCAALVSTGCASAAGPRMAQAAPAAPAPTGRTPTGSSAALADYVQQLPVGSRVRVERTGGSSVRGTLMKATRETMVVQKNTRVPEAPIDIPLAEVTRVTLDNGGPSMGKSIAIGVAVGVAATFGVLFLLFATLED
jgi:hypothetical protein